MIKITLTLYKMRDFALDYPDGERAAVKGTTKGRADRLAPDSDGNDLREESAPRKKVKDRLTTLFDDPEEE